MTVHPNSPTTNHEHNSLLTDERSSNSTVIFKWNYLFVLCFYTKSPGFLFLFLSVGLNTPFLENEYRGKERHVDTTTPTGRPNSTWDNVIPFILLSYHNQRSIDWSQLVRRKKTRSKQLTNHTFTAILATSVVIKHRLITCPLLRKVNWFTLIQLIVWVWQLL